MIQPYPMMQLESFEDALMEPMINNDNSDKPSMIFFYASWCGHCRNAKPEFEKLMQMAKGRANMMDCDAHQEIAQKMVFKDFLLFDFIQESIVVIDPLKIC